MIGSDKEMRWADGLMGLEIVSGFRFPGLRCGTGCLAEVIDLGLVVVFRLGPR